MPLDLIESEEEKNKNKPQAGKAAGGALIDSSKQAPAAGEAAYSGAEKGGASAPATPASQAQQTPAPIRGSGFTGVGRFLKANVGSGLGKQIAGRISQTGQQAGQKLQEASGQFTRELGAASSAYDEQKRAASEALQRISAGGPAPTQEDVSKYIAATSGQYKGPSGLQDIDAIRSQAELAQTLAGQTQSAKGRTALLQQLVGRGAQPYTKGQSALDALVLGQSGAALAQSRGAAAGLGRKVESGELLAKEQARQESESVLSKAKQLQQEKSGIEKKTISDVEAKQRAYETNLDALSNTIKEEIKSGEISKQTADILRQAGFDPTSRFYGLPLDQIATLISRKDPSSFETSATQEELQRLNALKQLSGQTSQFTPEQLQRAGTTIDPKTGLKVSDELSDVLSQQKSKYKSDVDLIRNLEAANFASDLGADPNDIRNLKINKGALDLARNKLYNEETGTLNVEAAKQLKDFFNWRRRRESTGFLGTGAGRYSRYEGDDARMAALQSLIDRAGSSFKIKPE